MSRKIPLKNIKDLKKMSARLRVDALEMIHRAKSGHTGGSMSCMDIMAALYFAEINGNPVLNYDPKKPGWDGQDYFILSKGHAAPALYSALIEAEFIERDHIKSLRKVGSLLQGHPNNKIPGVTVSTGSLGQGLSMAVGIAKGLKMDKKKNKVYTILGDGELQEGQVWEAAMSAAHFKLDNLIAFVDYNTLQIDGSVHSIMEVNPIVDKFKSFGWQAFNVWDGHDIDELLDAINKAWKEERKPSVIVAKTVKGKGVEFAENKVSYHGAALSVEEMEIAIPELKKIFAESVDEAKWDRDW